MTKHPATRSKNAYGETVHMYRGVEIVRDESVPAGYYGRYTFRYTGSNGAASLAHAKKRIDALLG